MSFARQVYLERLLTYAEVSMSPATWRRMVLGAALLASKVWDDHAVWNVDYCHILKDMTVVDMYVFRSCVANAFRVNSPAASLYLVY